MRDEEERPSSFHRDPAVKRGAGGAKTRKKKGRGLEGIG